MRKSGSLIFLLLFCADSALSQQRASSTLSPEGGRTISRAFGESRTNDYSDIILIAREHLRYVLLPVFRIGQTGDHSVCGPAASIGAMQALRKGCWRRTADHGVGALR